MNRLEERLREINQILTLPLSSSDKNKYEDEKKELLKFFTKQEVIPDDQHSK